LVCADRRKELSGSAPDSSNNRMDILAAVASLRALKFPCQVTLYSTNTYLTDPIGKGWAARWRANGWRNSERRPTPHADLWEELLGLCAAHQVVFAYLPFDRDNAEYARCDALAHACALRGKG
jgi:ribonuclease HI